MIVNVDWYVLPAKDDCLGILCRKCVTARAKGGLIAIYLFPSISVCLDGIVRPCTLFKILGAYSRTIT